MKKNVKLTIEMIMEVDEKYFLGNIHEKAFWSHLLSNNLALDDFYYWYYLEVFREIPGFEPIAEKLIKKDDLNIIKETINCLPEESAIYINNLMKCEDDNGENDFLKQSWDRFLMQIQKQFKPPVIIDANLETVDLNEPFKICKLSNAESFNLMSAQILVKGHINRLIAVHDKKELFDGNFPTLSDALTGFLKLFSDRKESKYVHPIWNDVEFEND